MELGKAKSQYEILKTEKTYIENEYEKMKKFYENKIIEKNKIID